MMAIQYRTILFALVVMVLQACSTLPSNQEAGASFIEEHKAKAITAQNNQQIAQALIHWQIIVALDPADNQANTAIKTLQADIDTQSSSFYSKGRSSQRAGNEQQAKTWYLKTLSLDPSHEEAMTQLKSIQSKIDRKIQDAKSDKENSAYLAKSGVNDNYEEWQILLQKGQYQDIIDAARDVQNLQSKPKLTEVVYISHIKLADLLIKKGQLEKALIELNSAKSFQPAGDTSLDKTISITNKTLGDRYYSEGTQLIKLDLDKAIASFQKALIYSPNNTQAQSQLDKAQKMQENLKKIERMNAK
ncbi:MAG: hypothetical protein V7744_12545 [Pseudomonadales bacterium]